MRIFSTLSAIVPVRILLLTRCSAPHHHRWRACSLACVGNTDGVMPLCDRPRPVCLSRCLPGASEDRAGRREYGVHIPTISHQRTMV